MNRALAITLCCLLCHVAPVAAGPPSREKVGAAVREQLNLQGHVRVVVSLAMEPGDRRRLDLVRQRVFDAQQSVLDSLTSGEFTVVHRYGAVPAMAGEVTTQGLQRLAHHDGVLRIDLDPGGGGNLAQAVPLTNTNVLHSLGLTGSGVTVAVLDSGIDTDHFDLGDDLVDEACFCFDSGAGCCPGGGTTQFGSGAAEDDHGHGSNVSGIVTSRGILASRGTAPDASIVAVKVLDEFNSFCCVSDVIAALDWIINNRPDVDIVNMSLGSFAMFAGDCDNATSWTQALASSVGTLRDNGVLSFVSTGNSQSTTQMQAPACVADAISVGAVWDSNVGSQNVFCFEPTTAADKVTCFSNRNNRTDLFAPGAPLTSAYLDNSLSTFYGTSQASPHAAGCAADLLQAFPGLDPDLLELTLESTGVSVNDPGTGLVFPRVDCFAALDALACRDSDGDGSPLSALCSSGLPQDCDDLNPSRFPGNPEICDGLDNDCDLIVPPQETTPPATVSQISVIPSSISWMAPPLALEYDVLRGDLGLLRASGGDFTTATLQCLADDSSATTIAPGSDPNPGEGIWFLVRPGNCAGAGSYESGAVSQVGSRDAEIAAAAAACP